MLLIFSSEILMNVFPWYATELFLRVCEAGGLSAASQSGRIGISQPALSAQMMTLERHLGKKLFHRKPFALTAEGRIFQEEALRMRARMSQIRDALADGAGRPLRIAASDVIIRDHLPELLKRLDSATRTRLVLREAPSHELAGLVRNEEADLAIGLLSKFSPAGSAPLVEKLAELPLVLYTPPSHGKAVKSWADVVRLLRQGEAPGLVALPHDNLVMRHIATSLRRMGIDWEPTLEVSSMGHVSTYVDLDFGFGFGFAISRGYTKRKTPHVIELPPEKVPPLHLVVWHGEAPDPPVVELLKLLRGHVSAVLG